MSKEQKKSLSISQSRREELQKILKNILAISVKSTADNIGYEEYCKAIDDEILKMMQKVAIAVIDIRSVFQLPLDKNDNNITHLAVSKKNELLLRYLKEKNLMDLETENKARKTALQISSEKYEESRKSRIFGEGVLRGKTTRKTETNKSRKRSEAYKIVQDMKKNSNPDQKHDQTTNAFLGLIADEIDNREIIGNNLIKAAEAGNVEVTKLLLEKLKKVTPPQSMKHSSYQSYLTWSLWHAARNGYLDIVKIMINEGADINSKLVVHNQLILGEAVAGKHLEVARVLIDKGADIHARDNNNQCAMSIALEKDDITMQDLLFEAGARIPFNSSIRHQSDRTKKILSYAQDLKSALISPKPIEQLQSLIEKIKANGHEKYLKNIFSSAIDKEGHDIFFYACKAEKMELVEFLNDNDLLNPETISDILELSQNKRVKDFFIKKVLEKFISRDPAQIATGYTEDVKEEKEGKEEKKDEEVEGEEGGEGKEEVQEIAEKDFGTIQVSEQEIQSIGNRTLPAGDSRYIVPPQAIALAERERAKEATSEQKENKESGTTTIHPSPEPQPSQEGGRKLKKNESKGKEE